MAFRCSCQLPSLEALTWFIQYVKVRHLEWCYLATLFSYFSKIQCCEAYICEHKIRFGWLHSDDFDTGHHVVLSFWRQPRSNMAGHHGDCPLAMNGILPTWSSSSALYIILCSRTPRLYCLPSTTLPTDPCYITQTCISEPLANNC